jgi:hypothetical protein
MAQRQLNIRSDDAAERAGRLAKTLGQTTTQVVEDALREYEQKAIPPDERGLSPDARRRYEAIMAAVERARAHIKPNAEWDESWMYDENGLPK